MIGKELFALGLLMLLFYIKWQITKESFKNMKKRKFLSGPLSHLIAVVVMGWVVFNEVDSGVAVCGGL